MTEDAEPAAPTTAAEAAAPDPVPAPTHPPGSSGNWTWMVVVGAAAVAAAVAIVTLQGTVRHWVAEHTGLLKSGPDIYYNFWSGFGADLGEGTLIVAVGVGVSTFLRKVNCHAKGCWRIGRHELEGTPYVLCRHHHPDVPNEGATHDRILAEHHRSKLERDACHG
ncbi:MAG: hypothetical protein R2701_00210 [Acidimicrobiales bacterium]|nr:hypothetical protein [Acidimicrobiales bacterium]